MAGDSQCERKCRCIAQIIIIIITSLILSYFENLPKLFLMLKKSDFSLIKRKRLSLIVSWNEFCLIQFATYHGSSIIG